MEVIFRAPRAHFLLNTCYFKPSTSYPFLPAGPLIAFVTVMTRQPCPRRMHREHADPTATQKLYPVQRTAVSSFLTHAAPDSLRRSSS